MLLYVSKCSFIWNTRSDTAGEKDFDATIQIALEHALFQSFKKIEIDRKTFFKQIHTIVVKWTNSLGRMI